MVFFERASISDFCCATNQNNPHILKYVSYDRLCLLQPCGKFFSWAPPIPLGNFYPLAPPPLRNVHWPSVGEVWIFSGITQCLSPIFSSGTKIFAHVSHSTELVRMCLACQHFDFNSADWISDNLHVISSWYLRTMGKEFILRISRRLWGRNAWRTPKNICMGG